MVEKNKSAKPPAAAKVAPAKPAPAPAPKAAPAPVAKAATAAKPPAPAVKPAPAPVAKAAAAAAKTQAGKQAKTAAPKGPTLANRAVVTRNSKVSASTSAPQPRINVPLAQRDALVAEAAYFLAEARNFLPGNEAADWIEAERRIDSRYTFA